VLVTGSAGRIGRAAVAGLLAAGWPVRGLDRIPTPGGVPHRVAGLDDEQALREMMSGAGALVHLAATPQDEDFERSLVPDNVTGLRRVLEAALGAGIRRWVLASSIQVNFRQSREGPWPVRVTDGITPLRWYAATKVMLEAAGYSYARDHGLEVVAVRLGWCPRDAGQVREIEGEPIAQDTYLSAGDAGRLVAAAVGVPMAAGFQVVFATSRPVRRTVFDLEPTRVLMGWEPLDSWASGGVGLLE
jgi:NAD(P)-dependent dehydrogenase (short-subunit alcohol dehydrogenase family)